MRRQIILFFTIVFLTVTACSINQDSRHVISLSGTWDIAQGNKDQIPDAFTQTVPVPGLVDMAVPAFGEVGMESDLREAFWYRKSFTIEGEVPAVAQLKIHKAKFSSAAWLENGESLGEHRPNFTPGYFDISKTLKGNGEENVLLIRIGSDRSSNPDNIADGWDFEKVLYLPGIYDEVEVILSGTPHILRTQVAPDINAGEILIQTVVKNTGTTKKFTLKYMISEKQSGSLVAEASSNPVELEEGAEKTIQTRVPIPDPHLWSPEDPFLYSLDVSSGADVFKTNFGMRSFEVRDGYFYLNGKKYFLRGSNVTMYRFFEDPDRKGLPWDKDWVKGFHQKIKDLNMNSLRYCIGFPPEFWYDIADEVGILLQDEYPIWYLRADEAMIEAYEQGTPLKELDEIKGHYEELAEIKEQGSEEDIWLKERRIEGLEERIVGLANLDVDQLVIEFSDWMHERANHASVVLWDAQNETTTEKTGMVIDAVRHLDLSNRPWDNGWNDADAGETFEAHPYYLRRHPLSVLGDMNGDPAVGPGGFHNTWRPNKAGKAPIVNEYAWLWLNRDGSTTTLTDDVYERFLGTNTTVEERRDLYINYLSTLTEYFRCHRKCGGVLHFCGLAYSRSTHPRGQTSDHFLDIANLVFEPLFDKYIKMAFSPVGLMLNYWETDISASGIIPLEVYVVNDMYEPWEGEIRLKIEKDGVTVKDYVKSLQVGPLKQEILSFEVDLSNESGKYKFIAELNNAKGELVQSIRRASIVP